MPVYILVKAVDGWNADDPMVYQTGYLVDARDKSRIGGKQVPPKFIQIKITDETDPEVINEIYCGEWRKEIDWEFVAHNYSIDGHRLKVFVKPEMVSVSGLNGLTRNQVETYLNRWNCTIYSIAQNEVIFDAQILTCIQSQGFWGKDTTLLVFDEKDYDEATGVHQVDVDYSNDPVISALPKVTINNHIEKRGGTVLNHPTGGVRFEISRASVFSVFKLDVKEAIDGIYARRKFKLLQAHVDMALGNGGTLSVTRQQLATYIYNRLDD